MTTTVDNNTRAKWVVNLSSTSFTKAQETLLARGPNITMMPKCLSKEKYIATMEEVCLKLPPKEAVGLRSETSQLLKGNSPPQPSISQEEMKAIKESRKHKSRIILIVDKGVAMVLDKLDYLNKAQDLLVDKDTYSPILGDATSRQKIYLS